MSRTLRPATMNKRKDMESLKNKAETRPPKIQSSPRPVRKDQGTVRQRGPWTNDATLQGGRKERRGQERLDEDGRDDKPDEEDEYLTNDEEQGGDDYDDDDAGQSRDPTGYDEPDVAILSKANRKMIPELSRKQQPKIQSQRKETVVEQTDGGGIMYYFCAAVIALVIFSLGVIWMIPDSRLQIAQADSGFEQNMQQLRSDFPSQEQHVWDTVEAAVANHLDHGSTPERPIVLLFGSRADASETTNCLAERLGNTLSQILKGRSPGGVGAARIDGREFEDEDADKAKLKVDDRLQDAFENGQKTATILNLDALPPCSILLFHGYCKNDNARYKDAALVFTITLDGEGATRSKQLNLKTEMEFQISDRLMKVWVGKCPKLSEEKVQDMLSSVANNVAIIKKEKLLSSC